MNIPSTKHVPARLVLRVSVIFAVACGGATSAQITDPPSGFNPGLDSLFMTPGRWADVGKTCTDAAPGVSVPAARRVAYTHGSDDTWAALARTVPGGFGGLLVNHGAMTMYIVDTTKFAAAANAVAAAGYPQPTAFLRGRWDFGRMFDWAGVIWAAMPPISSFSFFDIDEATNRLAFGAADSSGLAALDKAFASMDLPCRLVWIRIQGYASLVSRRAR
jgi:hypothetical protein